jgi:hypothetical protein
MEVKMLRKTLLACSVVLPLGLLGSLPAMADAEFEVHAGVPFYSYQVEPDYRYYRGYGWYDADSYPDFQPAYDDDDEEDDNDEVVVVRPRHISCGEARGIVRASGFRDVVAEDCDGPTYTFSGFRHGEEFTIYVNSRNGRTWRT